MWFRLRSRPKRDLGLRPVEELNREAYSLPDAQRLFAEVDEEYRQMEAEERRQMEADDAAAPEPGRRIAPIGLTGTVTPPTLSSRPCGAPTIEGPPCGHTVTENTLRCPAGHKPRR